MTIQHPEFDKPVSPDVQAARTKTMTKAENEPGGARCPCCGQVCKVYKRHINSPMARFLIWLVRSYEQRPRWIHLKQFPMIQNRRGGGDYGKLVHWGLVEQKPNTDDPDKRTSGEWRPTPKGIEFAHMRITVPDAVFLYDNVLQGFSDKKVDIQHALGTEFSYQELMSA